MPFFLARRWAARAVFAGFALALTAAPGTARAYCRTTTQALPANYSPSRCFTGGLLLYWGNACVGFNINSAGSRNVPYADAKAIIDDAFATWVTSTCPGTGDAPGIAVSDLGPAECAEVRYNGETANQNLIVFRDESWPYSDPNNTLGLTTVTFNAENGEIYDADMELNASGRNLSTTDQVAANGFDLRSVVTHEAGHFFGLAHAVDSKSTMYASYKPGTTALRTLTADDVAGLCAIYPSAKSRVVSKTTTQAAMIPAAACDATPRHGLTTKCEVPKVTDSGCSASPQRSERLPETSGFALVFVAAGVFVVRRRTGARARLTPQRG